MSNNNNEQHVTRYEFEAAMERIEALLNTQTQILIKLASAETDNKHRDTRIQDALDKASKAQSAVDDLKQVAAKAAGAASVLVVVAQFVLKKIGVI